MTAIITLFPGSNFLKEKSEKGRDIPTSSASKRQSWAWHLQPMALLVVFLPPYFTGRCLAPGRWGGGQLRGVSPKPQTPAQTHSGPPLPLLLGLGPHTQTAPVRGTLPNQREARRCKSHGAWGTEPRGADTAEKSPPGRGHLSSDRPTQPAAPQADPAPFRPADPAAPELVTQFLFCQAGLRHIFPVHLPLGSVLFPEGRVVEGAGSAPG